MGHARNISLDESRLVASCAALPVEESLYGMIRSVLDAAATNVEIKEILKQNGSRSGRSADRSIVRLPPQWQAGW